MKCSFTTNITHLQTFKLQIRTQKLSMKHFNAMILICPSQNGEPQPQFRCVANCQGPSQILLYIRLIRYCSKPTDGLQCIEKTILFNGEKQAHSHIYMPINIKCLVDEFKF